MRLLFLIPFVVTVTALPGINFKTHEVSVTSKRPSLDLTVGDQKEEVKIPVTIDLNTANTFVFGASCSKADSCSKEEHKNIFKTSDTPKDGTFDDSKFNNYNNFKGKYYNEKVDLYGTSFKADIGVVDSGEKKFSYIYDGRLGLGFSDDDEKTIVKKIFKSFNEKERIITYKQGGFPLPEFDKDGKEKEGQTLSVNYVFGKQYSKCSDVKFYPVINKADQDGKTRDFWQIKADIVIGDKTYEKQDVAFILDAETKVPVQVYEDHFKSENSKDFKDVKVKFDDKTTFDIPVKNYLYTLAIGEKKVQMSTIGTNTNSEYQFGLGREFLQHKCLVLREAEGKYEIGVGKSAAKLGSVLFLTVILSAILKFF